MKNKYLFIIMLSFIFSFCSIQAFAQTPSLVIDKYHGVNIPTIGGYNQQDLEISPDGSFVLESGNFIGQIPNMTLNSTNTAMDMIAFDPFTLTSPAGLQFSISVPPQNVGVFYLDRSISQTEIFNDNSGNTHVYYAGSTDSSFPNANVFSSLLPSATANTAVTVTSSPDLFFSKASINGGFQWVVQTNNPGYQLYLTDMTVDSSGDVYVVGNIGITYLSSPPIGVVTLGGQPISTSSGQNFWVAKISSQGQVLWTYIGGNPDAQKIEVFDSGAVIVAGTVIPEPNGICNNFPGSTYCPTQYFGQIDVFIALLDAGGTSVWQYIIGGAGGDYLNDIAFDNISNFYVSVRFQAPNFLPPPGGLYPMSVNDGSTAPAQTVQVWALPTGYAGEAILKFNNFTFNNITSIDYPSSATTAVLVQAIDVTRCGDLAVGLCFRGQSISLYNNLGSFSSSSNPLSVCDVLIAKLSAGTLSGISSIQLGPGGITDMEANQATDQFILLGTDLNQASIATVSIVDNDPAHNTCP